jgi:hypothetical protein
MFQLAGTYPPIEEIRAFLILCGWTQSDRYPWLWQASDSPDMHLTYTAYELERDRCNIAGI